MTGVILRLGCTVLFLLGLAMSAGCACGRDNRRSRPQLEVLAEGPVRVWRLTVSDHQTNCYVLAPQRAKGCALIDPSAEAEQILDALAEENLRPAVILLTHGHADHVGAVAELRRKIPEVEVVCHKNCLVLSELLAGPPRSSVVSIDAKPHSADGARIDLGDVVLEAYHIPGHAPGSLLYFLQNGEQGILFSGDTLFRETVGAGDAEAQARGLRKLLPELPPETAVYPGHGPGTIVSWELEHNPFLQLAP